MMAVLALACLPVSAAAWSLIGDAQPASLPLVELSLAAPDKPLPHVSAVISDLDRSREEFESLMMSRIQDAARSAVSATKTKVDAVITRFEQSILKPKALTQQSDAKAGFLQKSSKRAPAISSFMVHVKKGNSPPESFAQRRIQAMEGTRQTAEKDMFNEALSQFSNLGNRFAEELEAQLEQSSASFLGRSERAAFLESASKGNVRIVAMNEPYPTIETLVEAMQRRRGSTELLAREKIALMQIETMQAANVGAKKALSSAVRRITASLGGAMSLRSKGSTGKVAEEDFEVVLSPPEEKTSDVKASLDLIMKEEDLKREADEALFESDKQAMVNAEKEKIRSLVSLK